MRIDRLIRSASASIAANWCNPAKQAEARKELGRLMKLKAIIVREIGTYEDRRDMEESYAEQALIVGGYSNEGEE